MKNRIIKWLLGWLNRRQGGTGEVVTPQPEKPAMTDELDLATVVWHGPDIRTWPIESDLTASISRGKINFETDLLKGRAATGDNGTTGNPWAIAKGTDGQWHAYTFEWISYDRKTRDLWKAFDRGHGTPQTVVDAYKGKGTEFYVAVATVSRGVGGRNGDERTPFRKVVVP